MGLKILKNGRMRVITKYFLFYRWYGRAGTGFSFPCNEVGELLMDEMSDLDKAIYEAVEFGEYKDRVAFIGVISDSRSQHEPPVAECCTRELVLEKSITACPVCGHKYNQIGEIM